MRYKKFKNVRMFVQAEKSYQEHQGFDLTSMFFIEALDAKVWLSGAMLAISVCLFALLSSICSTNFCLQLAVARRAQSEDFMTILEDFTWIHSKKKN